MEYKCKFCGKTFKTEKGFEKHCCEKKKRYSTLNYLGFYLFGIFITKNHIKFKYSDNEELFKIEYVKSKYFQTFNNFGIWCLEMNIINIAQYMLYLIKEQIRADYWQRESTLRNFLYNYLRQEPENISIERSQKWLTEHNIDINNISSPMLYLALKNGFITKKFMDSINFTYKDKLLISEAEMNQLVYFLED